MLAGAIREWSEWQLSAVLRPRQDGPADEAGSAGRASGAAASGAGPAGEPAEERDTLSDVESDDAEEDKECAPPKHLLGLMAGFVKWRVSHSIATVSIGEYGLARLPSGLAVAW